MPIAIRPARRPVFLALLAACLAPLGQGCRSGAPPLPAPEPGVHDYQTMGFVAVPGALVNVAGGNLLVRRTDLSLETRIGPFGVGATYSSALGAWLWSFEATYAADLFVDGSGARHALADVAFGEAVPGTTWVRVDASRMKTKGGLMHEFDGTGALVAVFWSSDPRTRVELAWSEVQPGARRVTAIDQCFEDPVSGTVCEPLFDLAYDPAARLSGVTDRAGRQARFAWDADGRLAAARDGLDVEQGWPGFRYEYENGRLVVLINSEGERVEYGWQGARLATARAVGAGDPTSSLAYGKESATGRFLTTVTDPLGDRVVYTWDEERRVHRIGIPAVGEATILEWSGRRPIRRVAPDGSETAATWSGDDLASLTLPSGNVVSFTWAPDATNRKDPLARPVRESTDSLGLVLRVGYDAAGRAETYTNGAGEVTRLTYDAGGRVISLTPSHGIATRFSGHGEHGAPTLVEKANQTLDERSFDAVGNLLVGIDVHDPNATSSGAVLDRAFDADRNLARLAIWGHETSTGGEGAEDTTVSHRSDGRPLSIRRPFGADTEFLYDSLGRPAERRERVDGAWQVTAFEYDPAGRPVAVRRPNGMETRASYDPAGRLASLTHLRDGVVESSVAYTWTDGRLVEVLDSEQAGPETYTYDGAGRPARIDHPDGRSTLFEHDLRDRRTLVVYMRADGSVLQALAVDYDGADREIRVVDPGTGELLLERTWSQGRLVRIAYGNGLVRTFSHDEQHGFLASTETEDGQGDRVASSTYQYEAWVPEGSMEVVVWTETRDAMGLVPDPPPGSPAGWVRTIDNYFLDRSGLWTEGEGFRVARWCTHEFCQEGEGPTFAFDTQANLVQKDVFADETAFETRCLEYNAEHNRLLRISHRADCFGGALLSEVRTYTYDEAGFVDSMDGAPIDWTAHGRVASVGSRAVLDWDASGRLLASRVLGAEKTFLFGGAVEGDAQGLPVALDLGDVRIDLAAGQHTYRHFDVRANVRFVSDADGDVVSHYRYAPWGLHTVYGAVEDDLRFARGRAVGDLVALGARVYDPLAGRFLAPDPVFQVVNQYTYTMGNPIWFGDPGGTSEMGWQVFIGSMIVVGGIAGAAAGVGLSPIGPYVGAFIGSTIGFAIGTFVFQATNPGDRGYTPGDVFDGLVPLPGPPRRAPEQRGGSGGGGGGPGASFDLTASPVHGAESASDSVVTEWGRMPRAVAMRLDIVYATGSGASASGSGATTSGPGCAGSGGGGGMGGGGSCGLGAELALLLVGIRAAWRRAPLRRVARHP